MMRRDFIALLGGAAAWPLAARAQNRTFRVGFLGPSLNTQSGSDVYQTFRARLGELGFREGQNLTLDPVDVGDARGLFVAAMEMVRSRPDLIVASGTEASLQAVIGASGFIPIVILAINYDPLARGYVASLARPGGNITGVVSQQLELAQKQIQLLAQVVPDRNRVAVLFDAQTNDQFDSAKRAATSLNLQVQALRLEKPPYDFEAAFASASSGGAQAALVLSSPLFLPQQRRIAELTIVHRLPSMFIVKAWAQLGGLMSYGVDILQLYLRTADYVAKILKGAKAADLPVEQASKFEFVINLKTAKTLGLTIPPGILAIADELIE
jgi:putative tryptophan/tyrosine transport system substrate-binding protein